MPEGAEIQILTKTKETSSDIPVIFYPQVEGITPTVIEPDQELSKDMEEIGEIINCDANAEIKLKMITNIIYSKPHYFKPLQQEPDWIPCSERPPEEDGRYLVTCKIGFSLNENMENDETVDIAFYNDGHWSKYILYEDIYAWMPLPESYKENKNDSRRI